MDFVWVNTPTSAVLVIHMMTCLPLAWARATLAGGALERFWSGSSRVSLTGARSRMPPGTRRR
jgi:hypothetical protein